MTVSGIDFGAGAIWLVAALVLVIAELLAPGFFLIFLGIAAAVTGVTVLLAPGLPVIVQALVFAALTAAILALGRRWYRSIDTRSADPLLNDRAARLIGRHVQVCDAIVGGEGRVTVGDGAWTAVGPDLPAGTAVRIVGASGSVLRVEPA